MSVKKVAGANGVAIYDVSTGKSLPEWLREKSWRALRTDDRFRKRIELMQHLECPTTVQKIGMSADQRHFVITGNYPPQARVFDTDNLSMKFERRIDADVSAFQILTDDWKKLAFLRNDRVVELHSQHGKHHMVRVPHFGRDMLYYPGTCDLLIVGESNHVYRLNLDQGRFLEPWDSDLPNINAVRLNTGLRLIGVGGDDSLVQCWDPRKRKGAQALDVSGALGMANIKSSISVTSVQFHPQDSLQMLAGTSTGHVLLYDMRSSKPLLIKDHQYGLPIVDMHFLASDVHSEERRVASADAKSIKIWGQSDGAIVTAVEPSADINSMCWVPDSGLVFAACESAKVQAFFIPLLGRAPDWCHFLESVAESLEQEQDSSMFDAFQFVTKDQLKELGLEGLIGTDHLKEHLHGYFMDKKTYSDAMALKEPFSYTEWRRKKIQEKIESKRANRITVQQRLPKVNQELVKALAMKGKGKAKKKLGAVTDSRFGEMFENPEFQIDVESEEFRLLNPHGMGNDKAVDSEEEEAALYEHFTLLDGKEGRGEDEDSSDDDSDSDAGDDSDDDSGSESDEDTRYGRGRKDARKKKQQQEERGKGKAVRMYELKQGRDNPLKRKNQARLVEQRKRARVSLETRLKQEEAERSRSNRAKVIRGGGARGKREQGQGGSSSSSSGSRSRGDDSDRRRRGIGELGLGKVKIRGGYRKK